MAVDLRAFSDEALIAACRLKAWEKPVPRFKEKPRDYLIVMGPFAAFAVGGLLVHQYVHDWKGESTGFFCGWGVFLLIALILFCEFSKRRTGKYWHELQRRYAGLAARDYTQIVQEESARAGAHGAAYIVMVASCRSIGDDAYRLHVYLMSPESAVAEVRSIQPRDVPDDHSLIQVRHRRIDLPPEQAARIWSQTQVALNTEKPNRFGWGVFDGNPVDSIVFQRGRGMVKSDHCNFMPDGGPEETDQGHPMVALLATIFHATLGWPLQYQDVPWPRGDVESCEG